MITFILAWVLTFAMRVGFELWGVSFLKPLLPWLTVISIVCLALSAASAVYLIIRAVISRRHK